MHSNLHVTVERWTRGIWYTKKNADSKRNKLLPWQIDNSQFRAKNMCFNGYDCVT